MVDLKKAIEELKKDEALSEVKRRLEAGDDVAVIIDECKDGMTLVGEAFQRGDGYLAELMISGDIFKSAIEIITPYIKKGSENEKKGTVIMATLRGDIHNIGKDIVITLLEAKGFDVIDMGVDVMPEKVVEEVKNSKPNFVGFSSLLTPNFKEMKKCVDLLQEAGVRNTLKVMIGGGITTDGTREYVGADFQTIDAMQGVKFCEENI
jgi:methylmalonyl-CoA mutase cobalamin-binding domain/chain